MPELDPEFEKMLNEEKSQTVANKDATVISRVVHLYTRPGDSLQATEYAARVARKEMGPNTIIFIHDHQFYPEEEYVHFVMDENPRCREQE